MTKVGFVHMALFSVVGFFWVLVLIGATQTVTWIDGPTTTHIEGMLFAKNMHYISVMTSAPDSPSYSFKGDNPVWWLFLLIAAINTCVAIIGYSLSRKMRSGLEYEPEDKAHEPGRR